MKNTYNNRGFIQKASPKFVKIYILILAFLAINITPLFAQSAKLSLPNRVMTLSEIFKEIEHQSDFLFNYKDSDIKNVKKLGQVTNKSIEEILKLILNDTGLTYTIEGKHITISKVKKNDGKIKITGNVVDEQDNPLIGVTIAIKGSGRGTLTDLEGNFSLDIPNEGTVLVFTYIGYNTQEITVDKASELKIKLHTSLLDLEEVVVVGYGVQKKVNLTGAVGVVSTKDLTVKSVGQTTTALQGVLPGVTITQQSGEPGKDGGNIRIRGIGTLNNSNPLILIDGIEGSMDDVDPNVIESVSILKDAASAAIYGSRAANGVILVTTKRGSSGRYNVSYNNYFGWQKETDLPQLVDAVGHMELMNIAYENAGRDPLFSDELITKYKAQNGISSDEFPNTNWQKLALRGSGFQHNHYINIAGGSETLKTSTSVTFLSQDGIMDNVNFRRFSLRNNMDWSLTNKINAKVDIQYISPRRETSSTIPSDLFLWINGTPATQPAINSDGSWGVGWNGVNPIAHIYDSGSRLNKSHIGSLNASVSYKPFEWLTAEVNASPKYVVNDEDHVTKDIQTYLADGTPTYKNPMKPEKTKSHSSELYNNFRALVTAEKTVSEHTGKIMVGFSHEDYKRNTFSAYRDSINVDYPVLGTGKMTNINNGESNTEWALRSFFGRLNYDYKQKYLFEFNLRYDGSSRFKDGSRYATFPSLSGGWRISEEVFMERTRKFLNDAKVRVSWGKLGNQLISGNYPFMSMIEYGSKGIDGNNVVTGALNGMANEIIRWESTEQFDVGVDLTLFNKLTITADYYIRKTKDILLKLDIPYTIGLSAPWQNAGAVNNKGWEVSLGYRDKVGDFNYNVNFNISDVKNKITDLKGQDETSLLANRTGHSIQSLYGYVADGYFQSEEEIKNHAQQFGTLDLGDIKYIDFNEDGVIDDKDKRVIGSTIPRYTFGLNLSAEYKRFDLSAFFQGVGKADGYLWGAGVWPFAVTGAVGGTARQDNWDFWTEDNRNAKYPRLAFGATNNEQHSTFWMRDAKYLRFKNLQIGYTLPEKVTKKLNISRLRVFANGTNLFSIDNFLDGYNPETPVSEGLYYPLTRVFSFGFELNF